MTTPGGECIRRLSSAINELISSQNIVVYFGDKLVEEGLIDEQGKRNIITLGISDYDKTDRLMTAVKVKIEQDPKSFHRLVAILDGLVGFEHLVEQLKQNYMSVVTTTSESHAKHHRLVRDIISPVSNLAIIAVVLFALAIVVLTWTLVQDYITAVSTTVVFFLTCLLLTWNNMQHYIQNVRADMNVRSLLDTPKPAYFQPRRAELTIISSKFEALRKQIGTQKKAVVLYIVAPPAYGKTQLARHFAEDYFVRNKHFSLTLVVASVDATSESFLYSSYKSLAKKLKLSLESYSVEEGLLILARAIAAELRNRQQGWVLILDNLTLEVKRNRNASKLFPQPGSDDWGKGCVLVTTQDGQLVEKPNDFVMEYHLNDGMSEQDAMSFIQTLTGKEGDTKARELVNKLHRLPLGISVAGMFIQESRPSYSYSDYIQDLEAEDRFQDSAEEEVLQHESDSLAYKETQMKALAIFVKQQAKDPNLYKTFLLLATCANSPVPMRLVERAVAIQKVNVYSVRKSVKACSLFDVTSTKHLDEGGIEVVKVHQVTSRALKAIFLSDDAQHRNQLLHKFANCMRDEYLDQRENERSTVLQHKYIMQPHLETFLRIKAPGFELDTNECIQLQRALSLCYWFTQNFQKAQALMQESLKLSKQSPVHLAELEQHTVENALTLGIFYREQGRFDEAKSILKEWLPIAENLQGKQSVLVGRISVILGDVYRQMNSRQNLEHALAINEKINGSDYSSLADQLYALAALMIDAGRPSDALEYANRAASMLSESDASNESTPGKLHLNMLTLKALGVTFQKLGHNERAAKLLEHSLKLYIKVYSEESPSYAHPCSYLSVIHHQLGNFTRSKEMAETVYKLLGSGANVQVGPGLPWAMDRTAPVYIARGEFQKAEILLQRATQSKTAVGAPLVMKDAHHLLCTGVLAVLQGRFEEGMKYLLEIVPGEEQTHLSGVYVHAQLALMEIYLELGEYKQWLDMVPKLKKVNQSMNLDVFSAPWSTDPEAIHEYIHIGRTAHILVALVEMTYHHDYSPGKVSLLHLNGWKAYYQKDYVTAMTFLEQALQLQDEHYAPDNLLTAETLILSSVVLYCQGREDEAVNYLHRAMEVSRTQNPQHPLVGKATYVAGFLYNSLQKYEMAVMYLKEAQTVAEDTYQSSHPMITKVHNMINSTFTHGINEIQLCEDTTDQDRQDNLTRAVKRI